MNWTVCPTVGEAGAKVKLATGAPPAVATTTCFEVASDPEAFETWRVTVKVPDEAYVFTGFDCVELLPSPNVQSQEVGPPEDWSKNQTCCPVTGAAGEKVKAASGGDGAETTTGVVVSSDPPAFDAGRLT